MLCRIKITIGSETHDVPDTDIRNWDEIMLTIERKDYGGITRSFSSEFQFIGSAYTLLYNEYLSKNVLGEASISFYTITNNWTYVKQFVCRLDFTSVSFDGYTFRINAIDDSLAACIKSKKSSKYEFKIGSDITQDVDLNFDRVKMSNTATFIINGESIEGSSSMKLPWTSTAIRTYVNSTNTDSYENSPVLFEDEDTTAGSFFLRVEKDTDFIDILSDITIRCASLTAHVALYKFANTNPNFDSSYQQIVDLYYSDKSRMLARHYLGLFATEAELKSSYPIPESNVWAIVGKNEDEGIRWYAPKTFWTPKSIWINSGEKGNTYIYQNSVRNMDIQNEVVKARIVSPKAGDQYVIIYKLYNPDWPSVSSWQELISSKISVTWESRGKSVPISTIRPETLLNSLLLKVCNNTINSIGHISTYDSRIKQTYLLPAESIRGIIGAKVYSSFNDFAEWMNAVFGYTYYLGEAKEPTFKATRQYDALDSTTSPNYLNEQCPVTGIGKITLFKLYNKFLVYNTETAQYYSQWNDSDYKYYNDATTGNIRHDVLYENMQKRGEFLYFDDNYTSYVYDGNINLFDKVRQDVYFVHMSELYESNEVKQIENIKNCEYSIENSMIFSSLTIGYDKQDYGKENGRDEFNFSVHYDTDVTAIESKFELTSKYRPDCYGLEFTAQERDKDTTDNDSDDNIFFALCKIIQTSIEEVDSSGNKITKTTNTLVIDRSSTLSGMLSDSVFGGEYAPIKCIASNKKYLATMAPNFKLRYASSDGNSDVVIDGESIKKDIDLSGRLFTIGILSFSTDDTILPSDLNGYFSVTNNGVTYKGYLQKAEIKFVKNEGTKYTLIVKSIE